LCVIVCKNYLSLCKSVQWYKEKKKYSVHCAKVCNIYHFQPGRKPELHTNPCFVCNCVQKLPFTVQKCAMVQGEEKI
jgi:hypothetical protein